MDIKAKDEKNQMEIKKLTREWRIFRQIFAWSFVINTGIALGSRYTMFFIASFMSLIGLCLSVVMIELKIVQYTIWRSRTRCQHSKKKI